ncbi:hypothetical protein M440DRAFT_1261456 [Trichoderma longibrachiatum ATCC 18648]|uniref:Uncharacterized protein n=1 Tax=Trichoderma longibrachiatum ATCC 18648 TaxID=983965 RepID=A0A2T4C2J5_TRILO|nr:hypothetical protein M440DRAFT_1261456 [Trichoderma longibrachiatum ATCC 18648]
MSPENMAQPGFAYNMPSASNGHWNPPRSLFAEPYNSGRLAGNLYPLSSINLSTSAYPWADSPPAPASGHYTRIEPAVSAQPSYVPRSPPMTNHCSGSVYSNSVYGSHKRSRSSAWDGQGRYSPTGSVDDIIASPSLSDYSLDNGLDLVLPTNKPKQQNNKPRSQRRPSNRDEFDGPHQFLQRPPPDVIAMQERELPHLPTNLHVQEQDNVLNQVNDRLSQCAYDFVAKYQFPIPLTQDMRPVERPQDREWTEWVYLLKRLATKRRIPARVLYNGQIKQFVTILENSLEMRHAAKHQSRPLKDDRNILQLISAGIQVAKILKDASAMDYLDRLYVSTEKQIQERANARFRS